jgi:uncharacterized protein YciI
MQTKLAFVLLFGCISSLCAQGQKNAEPQIRKYWFVMLIAGPNRTQDSAAAAKIQAGHMSNIEAMAKSGKLKVAGPFGDDGKWRGIFILDCETQKEAEEMIARDPAISSGRLVYEIHPWYTMPTGSFAPSEKKQ